MPVVRVERRLAAIMALLSTANQQALEMFEKAVALDPCYAVAQSSRAFVKVARNGHAAGDIGLLPRPQITWKSRCVSARPGASLAIWMAPPAAMPFAS